MTDHMQYGYRIVGTLTSERRLVVATVALLAYAQCDQRAEIETESYLSAFCFGDDFREHLATTRSTKDFAGECWSDWLWFDIDQPDIDLALDDARKIVDWISDHWLIVPMVFFSGSKGFHVGVPTSLWAPEPSDRFHRYCRQLATMIATECGGSIDEGVYDRVRAFRAPNSTHPKTGLHKRYLTISQLYGLDASGVVELAQQPMAFDLPAMPAQRSVVTEYWQAAIAAVDAETVTTRQNVERSTLNRSTLDYIRDGAEHGDRHRMLFSAAANLAELGCTAQLAVALLSEPSLSSGLPASDVRRQIECGLRHGGGGV